jgi:hypothetical protein
MSRLILTLLLASAALLIFPQESQAWRRWRRSSSTYTYTQTTTSITTSYQSRAQAKANAMAARHTVSHYINGMGLCGPKEGVGCGWSRNCGTCTFSGTLVADAAAQSSSGLWYRVRVWR